MKQFFKYVFATIVGIILTGFLGFIFLIFIISAFVSSFSKADVVTVKNNSMLYLDLNQPILERTPDNNYGYSALLSGDTKSIGFYDLVKGIKKAETDDKIKGIYINITAPQMGMATMREVRKALFEFRKSGKKVIAYSEIYTQSAYYVASAASKVYLNPVGDLEFKGLNANLTFFKGALDKLGIEAQILRVGDFKSAVEPFTNTQMSDFNRTQTKEYLDSFYDQLIADISADRDIAADTLKAIANNYAIRVPEDALRARMIDGVKYKDEVLTEIRILTETKKNGTIPFVSINDYAKTKIQPISERSKNKIAVIYFNGDIVSGEGSDESIGSERLSRAVRKVRIDSNVKAVVLRINSPGGSALASDVMWREIMLTRKEKPVIASFGDVAASGGYYIGVAADSILVQPNTITGSIGVFGIIPNTQKFFNDKLGITFDNVKTSEYADIMDLTRPMTPSERAILQNGVNRVYDTFLDRVATGRKRSKEYINRIAGGRVWSGKDAVRLGLADRTADFGQAIKSAANKAKINDYTIVDYPDKIDPIKSLLSTSKDYIKSQILKSELGEEYNIYKKIRKATEVSGVQMRMLSTPEIN